MDMLSQRYADPCFIMNGMIQTCRLHEFVVEFTKTIHKEKEERMNWEFFLHKVWDGTYHDFLYDVENNKKNSTMSEKTIETTVKYSMDILNNFKPDDKN